MRGLANPKRSTAPSNGMDAKRSAGVPLSSPAAAQRCARGAGLDSDAPDAAQSAMPSIALLCSVTDRIPFHQGRRTSGASASVSNLHQLDGRDRLDKCLECRTRLPESGLEEVARQRTSRRQRGRGPRHARQYPQFTAASHCKFTDLRFSNHCEYWPNEILRYCGIAETTEAMTISARFACK
jgi:hypothetical protein